jgi:hypothetical protein
MSVPNASITVLDNQLGIRAPSDKVLAIVATAAAGDIATPQAFTRVKDVVAEHTAGPLVELAAYAIERYGLRVLLTRADEGTAGGYGSITDSTGGTSVITAHTATEPYDDYDVEIDFTVGFTVGVAGGYYTYSLDGGATVSGAIAVGTGSTLTLPVGNVAIDLAAGTVSTGRSLSFRTSAPIFDATTLDDCLDALRLTQQVWTMAVVYGAITSTTLGTIDAQLEAMATAGRNRRCLAHFRRPTAGESEATYLAAFNTALAASSSTKGRVSVSAGHAVVQSSISRREYVRPACFAVAPLACSVSEEVDVAQLNYGPLPGVTIADGNGNPLHHDERINPGLDDARALTLRSWEGRTGVWVNNPRLFSPTGSDFKYMQHGRIIDVACQIAREEVEPILSSSLLPKTDGSGQIDPLDADSIDAQVTGALGKALVGVRKARAATFAISRTDDVLTTEAISWEVRVVPLAYPKSMSGTVALVAAASSAVGG